MKNDIEEIVPLTNSDAPPLEIDRRDFMKIIFATAPLVLLPDLNLRKLPEFDDRPRHKPYVLELDESGYLFDPQFDYDSFEFPSRREHHGWDQMPRRERKSFLEDHEYEDWSKEELNEWLRSDGHRGVRGLRVRADGAPRDGDQPVRADGHGRGRGDRAAFRTGRVSRVGLLRRPVRR